MSDVNKEPSMEEILSSIKRIIAEDTEKAVSHRLNKGRSVSRPDSPRSETERESHRKAVIANMAGDSLGYADEVLELTDTVPHAKGAEVEPIVDVAPETVVDQMMPAEIVHDVDLAEDIPPAAIVDDVVDDGVVASSQEQEDVAPVTGSQENQSQENIVSVESEIAARSSLAALSSMVVKASAEHTESNTLEGLVRDMLRPMLKDWLDTNLPNMVEGMVAKEIARITGRAL